MNTRGGRHPAGYAIPLIRFTMKTPHLTLLASLLPLFGAGCVGSGPNTQQGAVGGAAAGAVAGAIIGNNSGSHNSVGGALIGGAVGAAAGAAIGNSLDHQRGTLYTSETEARTDVIVRDVPPPPPAPRVVEVRRDPRRDGAVWVEGHWIYMGGNRYEWVEGQWMVPPPRYRTYVAPHWERQREGQVYIRGYWRS